MAEYLDFLFRSLVLGLLYTVYTRDLAKDDETRFMDFVVLILLTVGVSAFLILSLIEKLGS